MVHRWTPPLRLPLPIARRRGGITPSNICNALSEVGEDLAKVAVELDAAACGNELPELELAVLCATTRVANP